MTPLEEIEHIANVPIEIRVHLDERPMKLSEILSLETGSVIEMHRSAGENLDILIGGRVAAFGEIVLIENNMGVRITDFVLEQQ
jgi:flagellar motor switch protein FliN/FliY